MLSGDRHDHQCFLRPQRHQCAPELQGRVASAIQTLEENFASNITIVISPGASPTAARRWTKRPGTNSSGASYTYDQVRKALTAAATSMSDFQSLASLTATDPRSGGQFWLTDAQAATLKLATTANIDTYVGLNSSLAYTFDPNHRGEAGRYDGIGVIEREITEIIGRLSWLGSYFDANAQNIWAPLELFRYSAPGVRDQTGSGTFTADGRHPSHQVQRSQHDRRRRVGLGADAEGDSFGATYTAPSA